MGKVIYLSDAIDDLYQIWEYVAHQSQSPDIADRLIDSIDNAANVYASTPELGVLRPELVDRLRCFPVGRYVIFYLPCADGIEIIQVIHGSRDIPAHIRRTSS